MEQEIWPQFLSSGDLELGNDRLSRRLLYFSRNAPHWLFSDEVLFAADCSSSLEICASLKKIINRVLQRVHPDPGVRVMFAAGTAPRIVIIAPRVKFKLLASTKGSLLRALGFESATYELEKVKLRFQTDYVSNTIGHLYCGDLGNNERSAELAPQLRVIKDIYVYSDIVQPSIVSNSLANLLDVIPVMSCVGENGVHRCSQPHYVRLH